MNISSEDLIILANGTVFTYKNKPLTFNIDPELILTFVFKDDVVNQAARTDGKEINANHAELTFINFNDPLGRGYTEPIKVGDINGRNVLMFIWITKMGNATPTKKIEYTFFKE
jgi:hypothetical protein